MLCVWLEQAKDELQIQLEETTRNIGCATVHGKFDE